MNAAITLEQVQAYMELTEDYNLLHTDTDFAAKTPFGKPIVYGTLVLNAVWSAFEEASIDLWNATAEIKFLGPVYIGDSLRVEIIGNLAEVFTTGTDKPVISVKVVE